MRSTRDLSREDCNYAKKEITPEKFTALVRKLASYQDKKQTSVPLIESKSLETTSSR